MDAFSNIMIQEYLVEKKIDKSSQNKIKLWVTVIPVKKKFECEIWLIFTN